MVDLVGPIQHKRGTTAAWATSQIPLRDGEIGIDTTTRRIKVGDGSTLFPGLPWVSSDAATIQRLEELATEIEGAVTPTDAAMAAAAGLPNGAFAGALSTKFVSVPAGGSIGQALMKTSGGIAWGTVATEGNFMVPVFAGSDMTTARPSGHAGPVEWIITVADGTPTHLQNGDKITEVSTVPVPLTVWADTFAGSGALGNTEVGGKPWLLAGTGYAAGRSGGRQVFTAATSSVGMAYVAAAADVDTDDTVTFRTTISTKGAANAAGVMFNVQGINDHLALARTSSGSGVYRIARRVASAYTTLATSGATWPTMADGDVIEIVIVKSTGAASFKINGTLCWSGVLTDFLSSIGNFGHYCAVSANFAEMAYDNASMITLAAA